MKIERKLLMTFMVAIPADNLCDEETLRDEFGGSWYKFASHMYEEEGFFWNERLELVDAKIISDEPTVGIL